MSSSTVTPTSSRAPLSLVSLLTIKYYGQDQDGTFSSLNWQTERRNRRSFAQTSITDSLSNLHFVCTIPESDDGVVHLRTKLLFFLEPFDAEWQRYKRDDNKYVNVHFICLHYVRQAGPQCGFAALAMIAASVSLLFNLDDMVGEAIKCGYTNFGEMFSAEAMAEYSKKKIGTKFNVHLRKYSLKGHFQRVKQYIRNENLIMIAYDSDRNYEPCLSNGHKAHWAVICGYVESKTEQDFLVIARHGKSCYPALWKYSALCASNENLMELSPARTNKALVNNLPCKLPPGGVKQGLSSQWILFEKK